MAVVTECGIGGCTMKRLMICFDGLNWTSQLIAKSRMQASEERKRDGEK